ncbi:MAG: hypothetical protein P1P88_08700 [Bacteroidales bacterium]|nr:hypothetical protein [Bacteroidales bacterium]
MKKLLLLFLIIGSVNVIKAQEGEKWQPQIHYTGYLNSVIEYSDHADTSVLGLANPKHLGIGLAQAGFLVTYKPLEKLEVKSTLVYSPWVRSWHDVVIETFGIYSFNPGFKLGAGKFLTPLGPSNLYFYAPLNPSGVLPMVVSHHIFFPQSISGVQIAGEFGDNLKINYNATYGNFYITDHLESGVLGIQGQEEIIPFSGPYEVYEGNRPLSYLGGSGRLSFEYQEMFKLGLNIFEGSEYNLVILDPATGAPDSFEPAKQTSLGVDLGLNIKNFELNAEYWTASNKTTESATEYSIEYKGYHAELIYNGDKFKPWVRYEYIEDAKALFTDGSLIDLPFVSYSGGVAYRPIFETIFKIEYRRVMVEDYQKTAFTNFKDYNYYLFSMVFSF